MTTQRMQHRKVLVTGSGTGIGREVALEFARQGATVCLHFSHSGKGAQSAVDEIRKAGGTAAAFQADFRDLDDVNKLAADTLHFLGGLDVLVNNAGITMNRPFEKVTPEQFDALYDVNIKAPFFLTQAVLPELVRAGNATVINMTSIHAFEGMPEHSVYAGTKGGLVAYTRELAIELAPKNVRVNAIAPGAVYVENYDKAMDNFDPEATGKTIPVGFIGKPLDIARVAVFLASEDARFIIGQTLVVDGGTTSWMPFHDGFRQPINATFGRGYVPGV